MFRNVFRIASACCPRLPDGISDTAADRLTPGGAVPSLRRGEGQRFDRRRAAEQVGGGEGGGGMCQPPADDYYDDLVY